MAALSAYLESPPDPKTDRDFLGIIDVIEVRLLIRGKAMRTPGRDETLPLFHEWAFGQGRCGEMPIPKQRLDERQDRSTEDWAVVVPLLLMLLVFLLAPMLYDLFQLR